MSVSSSSDIIDIFSSYMAHQFIFDHHGNL